MHIWTNRPIWPQGICDRPGRLRRFPDNAGMGRLARHPAQASVSSKKDVYPASSGAAGYDFGTGALGDMACHILGAPNLALKLGAPISAECLSQEGKNSLTYPTKSVIRFDFPQRGAMAPVSIYWHDGMEGPPKIDGVPESEILGDYPQVRRRRGEQPEPNEWGRIPRGARGGRVWPPTPEEIAAGKTERRGGAGTSGCVFVGDKGMMTTGTYGEMTRLIPVKRMEDYIFPEETYNRSPGHYQDWIRSAKGGAPSCSNFSIAGPFTEWILLGVLSLRFEGKLEWNSRKMKVTNVKEANELVKPQTRKGWKIA